MTDQLRFDGMPITVYDGAFRGSFDVAEEDGRDMMYDDVKTFIVTARVGAATFDTTKSGDGRRKNIMDVTNVSMLSPQLAEQVLDTLGVSVTGVNAGQQAFPQPSTSSTAAPSVTSGNGTTVASQAAPAPGDPPPSSGEGTKIDDPILSKFLAES